MIKFFRKIRQKLLTENKFSKYLLYAFGEIILVVIGILIAIQLNNINNAKTEKNQELTLLSEMAKNLELDLIDIEWNIERNTTLAQSNENVLKHLNEEVIENDSLNFYYGNILGNTAFVKNTSAYDNLKSIGLNLISNDSLRQQITRVYSEKYPYMHQIEISYDQEIQLTHIYPQLISKIKNSTSTESAFPIDLGELKKDNQFKEILNQNIGVKKFIIYKQNELRETINQLISSINKEITKG